LLNRVQALVHSGTAGDLRDGLSGPALHIAGHAVDVPRCREYDASAYADNKSHERKDPGKAPLGPV